MANARSHPPDAGTSSVLRQTIVICSFKFILAARDNSLFVLPAGHGSLADDALNKPGTGSVAHQSL